MGIDPEIVLYMKTKPDAEELTGLVAILEDPVTDLVRRDAHFRTLGLSDADVETADQVVAVLVDHPRLLQRPVVVKGDRAVIGRPKERIAELLAD